MIQTARTLKAVNDVPAPVVRLPTRPVRDAVPVILRATEAEAFGARQRLGGLRVIDRAIRLLGKLRDARVTIVTDGSISPPRRLPANTEVHEVSGDVDLAVAALEAQLGPEVSSVGADCVWMNPRRFDKALRVTDGATRAAAVLGLRIDLEQEAFGIVDRLLFRKIASRLTLGLLAHLPVTPALLSLVGGLIGLYGALLVATGAENVVVGLGLLLGCTIVRGCAGALGRVRLHRSAMAAWLDSVAGDLVNIAAVFAVGLALWRQGGTFLDMKIAAVAAGLNLICAVVVCQELVRQRESDVMKVRWWFSYGQPLRGLSGAGSRSIKAVLMFGRQDLVMLVCFGLAAADQLPAALLYMLIVAIVRGAGAIGQLLTPRWRLRPST